MSKTRQSVLVLLLAAIVLSKSSSLTAEEPTTKTLTGTYTWGSGGEKGPVTAVLTPVSEGHWKITFRVESQGSQLTYSGTADGQLGQGLLSGRVVNDATRPTFTFDSDFKSGKVSEGEVYTFKGEFKNGRFLGVHFSLVECKEEETGKLDLGF